MGVEYELKYAATEELLAHIRSAYPRGETLEMETTYYDTPNGALSKKRYTLRMRLENNIAVCTAKTPLPGNSRGEWEIRESDIRSAIPALCALGAPADLQALTKNGINPICGAKFTRHAVPMETPAFTAELALDTGILTGGGRETPLCEVELEYKSGNMEAFISFSEDFAKSYRLSPEPLSKFRRALNLYLGEK